MRVLFVVAALLLALTAQAQVTRTPWKVHFGTTAGSLTHVEQPSIMPFTFARHGDIGLYDLVDGDLCDQGKINYKGTEYSLPNPCTPIPASSDAGWSVAEDVGLNGDTIGMAFASRLCPISTNCRRTADFTFFESIVNIPSGTTLTAFTISFSGMDDGSRITVFNADHPDGMVVAGSYVFLGGSGTTNLVDLLIQGTNRVVITQVDDCCRENNLRSATVFINDEVVPPTDPGDGECPAGEDCTVHAAAATCENARVEADGKCATLSFGSEPHPCSNVEFWLTDVPLPWNEARALCNHQGGDIATINSQAEHDALTEFWEVNGWIWIGMTDMTDEGDWVWADGSDSTYTNWRAGEPNQAGNEDCAGVANDGVWNDMNCSGSNLALCRSL